MKTRTDDRIFCTIATIHNYIKPSMNVKEINLLFRKIWENRNVLRKYPLFVKAVYKKVEEFSAKTQNKEFKRWEKLLKRL